ncbi:MAG: M20/M25/M40 family metallo-hydrolase, partial [Chloroflexi bacterium]|nr:M20/M25/M40 family metallo-hydrolase [Chloroflexota bacterium]
MDTVAAPGSSVQTDELERLEASIRAALPAFLADLERLVNIDCGSYTPAGVDEVGRFVAERFERIGFDVDVRPDPAGRLGATVIGTRDGAPGAGPRLLLIGHMDTVFDPGTAAGRPFRIEDGVAYGPGVTDMKSGLLSGLYALEALVAAGDVPFERITYVANPDEEIGSPSSTPHIREAATLADVCLVLECARANGDFVASRKGTLHGIVTLHGRAAHAGVEPEKGRSAILAAADLTVRLHALNGRWPGVTVNVGVIHGGTRPNVVAERCELEFDIRAV